MENSLLEATDRSLLSNKQRKLQKTAARELLRHLPLTARTRSHENQPDQVRLLQNPTWKALRPRQGPVTPAPPLLLINDHARWWKRKKGGVTIHYHPPTARVLMRWVCLTTIHNPTSSNQVDPRAGAAGQENCRTAAPPKIFDFLIKKSL